jgi:heat shock protein HslJ
LSERRSHWIGVYCSSLPAVRATPPSARGPGAFVAAIEGDAIPRNVPVPYILIHACVNRFVRVQASYVSRLCGPARPSRLSAGLEVKDVNKKQLVRYLLLFSLALLVAACNGTGDNTGEGEPLPEGQATLAPEGDNELANTSWLLVSFGATGSDMPVLEGTTITLEFESATQLGGSGGCNSYGADYTAHNGTITVGEVVSTLMACVEEGVTEQEQDYLAALSAAEEYELAGDQLTIWYNGGAGVLIYVAS